MPVDNTSLEMDKPKGRWMLLLLFVTFALPVLLVVVMHKFDWHPKGSSYGEMITPPKPVTMLQGLLTLDGKAPRADLWHDKWSMVYVIRDSCEKVCQERLHIMRQLHVSMGKESDRVQRLLIAQVADAQVTEVQAIQQQYPDLIVIGKPGPDVRILMQQFDLPGEPAGQSARIYLVDPLGNLMMSYPLKVEPTAMRKDLVRLLTYAWAG